MAKIFVSRFGVISSAPAAAILLILFHVKSHKCPSMFSCVALLRVPISRPSGSFFILVLKLCEMSRPLFPAPFHLVIRGLAWT
ncbi:hypothetical protein L211DRAFT_41390 [Terfezia boudieri ATCC MYA-4762]|uniref:Uncharacterized protein n=1 Tax=Terfezia boudieri ATCC MYA-4762 TaxID=1051890 RepID=A0A3N4MCX7_9PEZI|nr:hypothetical protein L211DRAFT_41390 [Terfezia boudieri ATCC MYA-4762]